MLRALLVGALCLSPSRRRTTPPLLPPPPIRTFATGCSGRSAPAARSPASASPPSRRSSSPACTPAACGRPTTTGARGGRSSTARRPDRSATSASRGRTPTSSTSGRVRGCIGRTWESATASSSRPTAASRGSTSASPTCSRSAASSSILPTRTSCSSPVSGIPYGPNAERGIFRTTNGGATWEKVLFVNENTGGIQVEFDPKNPNVVYGVLWEHREGPWENASFSGPNSGLYKSTDGGTTWRQLKGGLPARSRGSRTHLPRHRRQRSEPAVRGGHGAGARR